MQLNGPKIRKEPILRRSCAESITLGRSDLTSALVRSTS